MSRASRLGRTNCLARCRTKFPCRDRAARRRSPPHDGLDQGSHSSCASLARLHAGWTEPRYPLTAWLSCRRPPANRCYALRSPHRRRQRALRSNAFPTQTESIAFGSTLIEYWLPSRQTTVHRSSPDAVAPVCEARTTPSQLCSLLFSTRVQNARRLASSSASILAVVWLATRTTSKCLAGSERSTVGAVRSAFWKFSSSQATGDKLPTAMTKRTGNFTTDPSASSRRGCLRALRRLRNSRN